MITQKASILAAIAKLERLVDQWEWCSNNIKNRVVEGAGENSQLDVDASQLDLYLELLRYQVGDKIYYRVLSGKGMPDNVGKKNRDCFYPHTLPLLQKLDEALYIIPNGGGHDDKDVKSIRAIFADFDKNISLDEVKQRIQHLSKPTFIVRTRHGFHVYWVLSKLYFNVGEFKPIQQDLAELLGSDKEVVNPSRVMRAPGGYHTEVGLEPLLVEIIEHDKNAYYTFEFLREAIPSRIESEPNTEPSSNSSEDVNPYTQVLINEVYGKHDLDELVEKIFTHESHEFEVYDRGGKYKGGCPFHDSTSGTSFYINKRNGNLLFRCAGCGEGGDAIKYIHSLKNETWSNPEGEDFRFIACEIGDLFGVDVESEVQQVKTEVNQTEGEFDLEARLDEIQTETNRIKRLEGYAVLGADFYKSKNARLSIREMVENHEARQIDKVMLDSQESLELDQLKKMFLETMVQNTFLINDLFRKGTTSCVFGDSNSGKTTLVRYMIICLLRGRRCFGHDLEQSDVLFMTADESKRDYLPGMASMGFFDNTEEMGNFYLETSFDFTQLDRIKKHLKRNPKIRFIVIDSLTSCNFLSDVKETETAYAKPLLLLKMLAEKYDVHIMVLHHTNRNGGYSGTAAIKRNVSEMIGYSETTQGICGRGKNTLLSDERLFYYEKTRIQRDKLTKYVVTLDLEAKDMNLRSYDLERAQNDSESIRRTPTKTEQRQEALKNFFTMQSDKEFTAVQIQATPEFEEVDVRRIRDDCSALIAQGFIDYSEKMIGKNKTKFYRLK